MATVTSSLKLFDAMTRPLQNITQGMNMMISTMYKMQGATDKNVNVDKMLIAAKNKISDAEADIRRSIDQGTASQKKFNKSVQNGKKQSDGLLSSVKQIAAVYLGFQAAKNLFQSTVGGAMQQQESIDTFVARSGNEALGNAIYDQVTKQALKMGQDVNAALSGTMSFMSNTLDPQRLTDLNKLAVRLSKLNPAEGLRGAAFSLKELMAGDYTSIAERFNISRSTLKDSEARIAGMNGDVDGFILGMDKLLNSQNMTEEAFEKMLDSPTARWNRLVETFKFKLAGAGKGALQAFLPLIDRINTAFEAGKFESFFNAMGVGLSVFANGVNAVVNAAMWLGNVFNSYGPEITAMLIAWGSIYLPIMIIKLWAMVPPLYASAAAWLVMNWPILLVIAAVGLLIFILRQFGVSTGQIVGFVTGVFYALFAFIWNNVAVVWNILLSFAEFLNNIFIDPVYAIKKLFFDVFKSVMDYFGNLTNLIVKGLNWIIEKINSIADTKIRLIPEYDSAFLDQFEPKSNKNVVDFSKYRMEQKDVADAFGTGYSKGADTFNKVADSLKGFSFDGMGMDPKNIDRVDVVGKINDTVDISSEDLKMMRELAELKNIQNFVTLTPTVQVTHTGDINNGQDVNGIVAVIKETLETEIASSTEEVYS